MNIKTGFIALYFLSILFCESAYAIQDIWKTLESLYDYEKVERIMIQKESETLLLSSDFDKLDLLAEIYRSDKQSYSNGEMKLSVFYDGMSYYLKEANEENWKKRVNNAKLWVQGKPSSIAAKVTLAECLIGYAFHKRSREYSKYLTEEQRIDYDSLVKESLNVLIESKDNGQRFPEWWASLQRVALCGGFDLEQYNHIFSNGIMIEPSYNILYFRAAWHLLPWWYGGEGSWENFSKSIADTVNGPEGDVLYARIIWFMDQNVPKDVVSENPNIDWKRVEKGIQGIKNIYQKTL